MKGMKNALEVVNLTVLPYTVLNRMGHTNSQIYRRGLSVAVITDETVSKMTI